MKTYGRVYEAVDLDAIRYNMEEMKANLKPETKMIGVVKSDGYGHGSVPVSKIFRVPSVRSTYRFFPSSSSMY